MRLTLGRALLVSLGAHLLLAQVPVSGLLPGDAGTPARPLLFELVDAPPSGPRPSPARREDPGEPAAGNVPEHVALPASRGRAGQPGDRDARRGIPAAKGAPAVSAGDGELTATTVPATSPAPGGAAPPVPPAPLEPVTDVDELVQWTGLDLDGLPGAAVERIYPLMRRWVNEPGRRTASSYRELLRTYIDVLMGYPEPIVAWLRRQRSGRYLAELEVTVGADGRFEFTEVYFYPTISDPEGRLRDHYRRVFLELEARPFVPPAEAGLPAPHSLSYKLLNPEVR